jgi:hypothetical protein
MLRIGPFCVIVAVTIASGHGLAVPDHPAERLAVLISSSKDRSEDFLTETSVLSLPGTREPLRPRDDVSFGAPRFPPAVRPGFPNS